MAEPLHSSNSNVYRPVQWDRRLNRRGPGRLLGLIFNRRVLLAVMVIGFLLVIGNIVGGEDTPPAEVAPTPPDESTALVAVRAAEARAGFGITVQVEDGTVILSGVVPAPSDSVTAETVARSVVGTDLRIDNQLQTEVSLLEEAAVPLSDVTDAELALQHALSALLTRNPIVFESASAQIAAESQPALDALVTELAATPNDVLIAGHTDSDGDEEANLALSQARADAVLAYLVGAGIGESRLAAQGFGEAFPVSDNVSQEGKAANRRIDVLLQP